jgi:hypothetical protein
MKRDKYTCKTDGNQSVIVKALRDYGCSVTPTHMVGGGYPDLSVGFNGKNILLEIKMIGKGLNEREQAWFRDWKGQAAIAYTPDEAIQIMEALCN